MVKFRTGIFLPGLPVQPVAIRCPFRYFSMSWESIWFREHIFRTMIQFVNHVELIKLPVYAPSAQEQENPQLYASNVQTLLSSVLQQSIYVLNRKHKGIYHKCILSKLTEQEALDQAKKITEEDKTLAACIE